MPTLNFTTDLPIIKAVLRKNGSKDLPIDALVDTGTTLSIVDLEVAQTQAKTPATPVTTAYINPLGSGYPILVPLYDFSEIEIGGKKFRDVMAAAVPLRRLDHSSWRWLAFDFKFIIGKDLQELIGAIEIDHGAKAVSFR